MDQLQVAVVDGLEIEVWRPTGVKGIAVLVNFDELKSP